MARVPWCPGHCTALGAQATSRTPRSGGEHRSRILDVAEHRGILTRTGLTSNGEAWLPQRGLTASNVGVRAGMQHQCSMARGSSVERRPPVQETIRRFLCAGCRVAAYVCTACDRGQRYCSDECALAARRRLQRESDRRYQSSERGRLKHAERARRYRQRRRSVTEQGAVESPKQDESSTSAPHEVSTPPSSAEETATTLASQSSIDDKALFGQVSCHFCRRWCDQWIRHAPLRPRRSGPRRKSRRGRPIRAA
jgi:hypothetical protein